MPLKLNIGWSKKIGQPDFGSLGSSVHLELEVDSTLAAEPDRLQERIRELFGLAKASVDEELRGASSSPNAPGQHATGQAADNTRQQHANGRSGPARSATGAYRSNGNGRQSNNPPPATASQIRAIHAIAKRLGLSLEAEIQNRFDITDAAVLTIAEASQLIDELNNNTAVAGGRR